MPKTITKAILDQLALLLLTYPELRVGQLLLNAKIATPNGKDLYNLLDVELLDALNKYPR
jgi:hypothetical protein